MNSCWGLFRHNFHQLLIALDQLCNVFFCMIVVPFEKSWADETFSSRCYRWDMAGKHCWPRKLVDVELEVVRSSMASFVGYIQHCDGWRSGGSVLERLVLRPPSFER